MGNNIRGKHSKGSDWADWADWAKPVESAP